MKVETKKQELKKEIKTLTYTARKYEYKRDYTSADICYYKIAGLDNRLRRACIDAKFILFTSLIGFVLLVLCIL